MEINHSNKRLLDQLEKARLGLTKTTKVLKGNLVRLKTTLDNDRKPAYQITWKGSENKTKTLYVSNERVAEVKQMLSAYKKAKMYLERMADLNADLYKLRAK